MVATLASASGIRTLSIKGPVADHYRFRAPRIAADADILVEPRGFGLLCSLLEARGWHQRVGRATPSLLPQHSLTYVHAEWPCDLDLHCAFPGFFGRPDATFEALWSGRSTLSIGNRDVSVPSRTSAALIGVLHALRTAGSRRHETEMAAIAQIALTQFSDAERGELWRLAKAGGATWTAEDLLLQLGFSASASDATEHDKRMWTLHRTYIGDGSTVSWWEELRSAPWNVKPALLVRALWVPRADIPRNDPKRIPSRAEARSYRIRRWIRGGRAMMVYASRRGERRG
ncbi:nucleotidyltransferase family protein [Microbacterium sp. NPDC057741]